MPGLTEADVRDRGRRIEQALATLENERQRLLGPDGQRIYSDEEHERREAAALARFDEVGQDNQELVNAVARDVEKAERALEDRDPLGLDELDDAQRARMNAHLPVAQGDVDNLPITDLETRCRVVLAGADREQQVAYGRAILWKMARLQAGQPAGPGELRGLAGLAQQFTVRLADPKKGEKQAAAETQRERSRELRRLNGDAVRKAHRTLERAVAAGLARYGRF